ncbi:MAG: SRPBCC domain-containing protein [Candidatus Eremiobacteraeota bacterium]|nr:SRPBCC domain-containing protein [Candidatus Eremiobacteraeota bacterium]MBV8222717.1 SRPBCC domain-containing protein [Candidatus Eremiobacteraeota bacterium]MBV8281367.1 SRPBCC domain-containing protein [Candidatus Eremiobacteraeota bacterium]
MSDRATTDTMLIVKEITLNASRERVFKALTDPQELPQFWGEGVDRWEADVREGGRWQSSGAFPDGRDFSVRGTYLVVRPPTVVEMTVEHTGMGAVDTRVRYDLTQTDGLTRLRVTHSGFIDKQSRDHHSDGWDQILARMATFVHGERLTGFAPTCD